MGKRRKRNLDRLSRNPRSNREQVKDPEKRSTIKKLIYGTALLSALVISDQSRQNTIVNKSDVKQIKESGEYAYTPPELAFEKDENVKKPALAKELNENQIKKIALELKKYCEFHLKNVEKLVKGGAYYR